MTSARTPILLSDASYYGTLAAVRSLGRAGVPVVVVDSGRVAPASWSRYTARALRCPPASSPARLVEWLLKFGEREGRHVLYPTSDELVFLLAVHHAELSRHFALYQPGLETILRLLDKRRLLEAACEVGFDAPETWFPESASDVERAARHADGPLMIKPRTQVLLAAHPKGVVTSDTADLVREYDRFHRENTYGAPIAEDLPELTRPMLQRYYPGASNWIYSLTGFRDRTGRHLPLLGAVKVLQRPRRLGVGLCFESAPVLPGLAERTARLLERLGYFGVFEIEFLRDGDRLLLIDMNPRLYNQIALDVARGMDLPQLAYAAALGDDEEVGRLVARVPTEDTERVFCNGVGMRLLVGVQRLFGTMSRAEAARWLRWANNSGKVVVDSVRTDGDPGPLVAEAVSQVYDCLAHPRAFLRKIALDR